MEIRRQNPPRFPLSIACPADEGRGQFPQWHRHPGTSAGTGQQENRRNPRIGGQAGPLTHLRVFEEVHSLSTCCLGALCWAPGCCWDPETACHAHSLERRVFPVTCTCISSQRRN